MGDFIKELNIIDFLGMLLPGSVFLVLSGQGGMLGELCAGFFGKKTDQVAMGIFLIVAGYIVGMLFHEVGDLSEKFLWNGFLDPRYFAARAVGLDKILEEAEEEGWPLEERENIWWQRAKCLLVVLSTMFYAFVLLKALRLGVRTGWVILFVVVAAIGGKTIEQREGSAEKRKKLRAANAWIQTEMVDKQNCKKRVVFDGFHVMMRNLILVIALLNSIPGRAELFPECVLRCMVIIMLLRYVHYAYLKYKYSYEDYLKEHRQQAGVPQNTQ